MASVVAICNRALQKLGAKRIVSLSDDSVNARACNVAYEAVRDAEYEDHNWNFAISRATLAASSTAPDWGRTNSFPLPSDFIRIAPDYPEDITNDKDWVIEGQSIYSNDSDPIYLRYIARITDPNIMTSLFREALSAKMAVELCEELSQSNTKKADLIVEYEKVIRRAKRSNALQNIPTEPPEDLWISRRA